MANLRSYDQMDYHPLSEEIVTILTQKTQNTSRPFYRITMAYYLSKLATTMRTTVTMGAQKGIPVNMYALNLAESGFGKGMSTNIIEDQIIHKFHQNFTMNTYPTIADKNLDALAFRLAAQKGTDHQTELDNVRHDFERLGSLLFSFDSGTSAALKQMRQKLLMAQCGSLNFEMDEVGTNLLNNTELLATFLELFDVGKIKQKLIKNTVDNKRDAEIIGRTPANMLLYGTPARLLNGGKEEAELYQFLETGYGRRFWYGYSRKDNQTNRLTPEQLYDMSVQGGSQNTDVRLEAIATELGKLASLNCYGLDIPVGRDVGIQLITYRQMCEDKARSLPQHAEIRKAELEHRYFRVLKLMGTYAFIDGNAEVSEDNLYQAMKLCEDSGDAFDKVLTREKNHIKLAKYIAEVGEDVTQADMVEDLPFYKGSNAMKSDMLAMALSWGYKNNIIIKKSFVDGIEFLRGESLQETDLNNMIVSWSDDIAYNYNNETAPFDQLDVLTGNMGLHWVNHHLKDGHRKDLNAIPGFNILVLDVDGTAPLAAAQEVLKNHMYWIYTTKRHGQDGKDRYRILLPTSHVLKLSLKDYREFMNGVKEWFPFEMDEGTFQPSKKWLSHNGTQLYNDGELFDVLPFIPRTSKDEERKKVIASQSSMDNLERWIINNTGDGNRNNNLMRYGFILADMGLDFLNIQQKVFDLNDKMVDALPHDEINATIMKTIAKRSSNQP